MTIKSRIPALFAAIVASMALAGCATTTENARHRQHHPAAASASTTATASPGMHHGQMEMMMHDPKAMCEMHKKMMSGKTPEEQKAMMDERMKSMSPEMMKKHHAMMAECK